MAEITLKQAQEQVDSWIKTYGVRYFNELTNMTILTEEVSRLADTGKEEKQNECTECIEGKTENN